MEKQLHFQFTFYHEKATTFDVSIMSYSVCFMVFQVDIFFSITEKNNLMPDVGLKNVGVESKSCCHKKQLMMR